MPLYILQSFSFFHFIAQMYYQLYDLPHTHFAINAICFSQDCRLLASGDDDGYIRLLDIRLGKESRRLRVANAVTSLLWHPNNHNIIFIGGARGNVTVMNLQSEVGARRMSLCSFDVCGKRPEGFSLRTGVDAPVESLAYDACNGHLAVGVGTDIILFNHPEGESSCGKVTTRQAEFLADPWTFGINIPPPPSTAGGDDTKHLLPLPRVLKFSDDGHSLIAVYFQHGIVWAIHHFIEEVQLIIMQDPG